MNVKEKLSKVRWAVAARSACFVLLAYLIGATGTTSVIAQYNAESRIIGEALAPYSLQAKTSLTPEEIREAEERLSGIGYWTGPVDGEFDVGSRHAFVAFQKVEGRERTGELTAEELQALRNARRPKPLEGGYSHIEVDLKRQVLFVVDDSGTVTKILPVSSGNRKLFTSEGWTRRAVTPTGRFTVLRKIAGWRKSALGLLYYPLYIIGGVAIHGSLAIPAYPASHGCIRIPLFAAKELYEMTPIGTPVIVHDGALPPQEPDIP